MSASVSIVVPVYAGEPFLADLVGRVNQLRTDLASGDVPLHVSELVLVLDEPRDGSPKVVAALAEQHDWVHPVHLSRNFGQHPATAAGLSRTSGDWVVTLDEDLQHDPAAIPAMIATAVVHDSDVIYAGPVDSVHGGWRDGTSTSFKRLAERLAGARNARQFNSFRVLRGDIAREAARVSGHETYLDVALSWFTERVRVFPILQHDDRGESSYTLWSLLAHARRLVISGNLKVLRIAAAVGLIGVGVAVLAGLWLLAGTVFGFRTAERGWLSIMTGITFFGGTLAFAVAIISEYTMNMAQKLQGRPTFWIADRSGDAELRAWAQRQITT